jgi:hypothetical protein
VASAKASRDVRIDELLGRSVVVFCTFIPLFSFREFRRVMGEKSFYDLLFHPGHASKAEHASSK